MQTNCGSRANPGTLHVQLDHCDFVLTDCVTAGSADKADNLGQKRTQICWHLCRSFLFETGSEDFNEVGVSFFCDLR